MVNFSWNLLVTHQFGKDENFHWRRLASYFIKNIKHRRLIELVISFFLNKERFRFYSITNFLVKSTLKQKILLDLIVSVNFIADFCPHLGSLFFVVVLTTFRLRIGMLSLVTESLVIPAFHSCCQSHHVFFFFWPGNPLTGLGRNWTRYLLTMLTWNGRDSTPLIHCATIKVGLFGLINSIICSPYLVFHSRVRTEFVIVFIGNPFWDEAS